jgi:hypothetical protein
MRLPNHSRLLEAGRRWLEALPLSNALAVLDLLYLEQRVGCWAAPQTYGVVAGPLKFWPFAHRDIFANMLRLPIEYRLRDALPADIVRLTWPELLAVPFNRYTGPRRYIAAAQRVLRIASGRFRRR